MPTRTMPDGMVSLTTLPLTLGSRKLSDMRTTPPPKIILSVRPSTWLASSTPAPIKTTLEPLVKFYPAEAYHQDFAARNPRQGYVAAVARPKVVALREQFPRSLAQRDEADRLPAEEAVHALENDGREMLDFQRSRSLDAKHQSRRFCFFFSHLARPFYAHRLAMCGDFSTRNVGPARDQFDVASSPPNKENK